MERESRRTNCPVGPPEQLGDLVEATTDEIARQCDQGELLDYLLWIKEHSTWKREEVWSRLRQWEEELGRDEALRRLALIKEGNTTSVSMDRIIERMTSIDG